MSTSNLMVMAELNTGIMKMAIINLLIKMEMLKFQELMQKPTETATWNLQSKI
jgi:hypothetical protein